MLAASFGARQEGSTALHRGGPDAFFKQVVVRLLRLILDGEARRSLGAASPGKGLWLYSREAAPDLHAIRLPGALRREITRLGSSPSLGQALGAAYESLLELGPRVLNGRFELVRTRGARRSLGSFYTPAGVASRLLDETLGRALRRAAGDRARILALRVCDPACGAGNFLVGALDRIAAALARASGREAATRADLRSALACIHGVDIDPVAADLCRAALWLRLGDKRLTIARAGAGIRQADALTAPWDRLFAGVVKAGGFDVVVGNPPFLNQLGAATAHARHRAAALKTQFGHASRAYTDPSALFLLQATRITRRGGRIALIQPQSILASRDAAEVRRHVLSRAALTGLWVAGERVFDAGTLVCAPMLAVGAGSGRIRRWRRAEFEALPDASADDLGDAGTWAPLAADAAGVPAVTLRSRRTLAQVAAATADFRDQYYGLRGLVVEDASLNGADRSRFPPLITSGLLDPGVCRWGDAGTRFDGRPFAAPRVDLDGLGRRTDLGPWSRARLVPKVLLATQTRILEAAVDDLGQWLPAVPVITVIPRDPADVWRIAAAILSPVASAWALRFYGGAGLSADAIKLSARQAQAVPIPRRRPQWDRAGDLVRQAAHAGQTQRVSLLTEAATLTCAAHGLSARSTDRLVSWWRSRAGW
jgi:hypothetical protein